MHTLVGSFVAWTSFERIRKLKSINYIVNNLDFKLVFNALSDGMQL